MSDTPTPLARLAEVAATVENCRRVLLGMTKWTDDSTLSMTKGDLAQLLEALDAERQLRAAAEKYGAPVSGARPLGFVKHKCEHDQYWTTVSGACMACRAVAAEQRLSAALAERDAARESLLQMTADRDDLAECFKSAEKDRDELAGRLQRVLLVGQDIEDFGVKRMKCWCCKRTMHVPIDLDEGIPTECWKCGEKRRAAADAAGKPTPPPVDSPPSTL